MYAFIVKLFILLQLFPYFLNIAKENLEPKYSILRLKIIKKLNNHQNKNKEIAHQ